MKQFVIGPNPDPRDLGLEVIRDVLEVLLGR